MTDPWNRRCRGAALLALLLALPSPAAGEPAPDPAAAPAEEAVEFRPLPPIELPKPLPKPVPEPAPPPEPEPEPGPWPPAAAPDDAEAAPAPSTPIQWPRDPSDKRFGGCLILTVGAYGSDADPGLMAEVGFRALAVSLRYAWRWGLVEDGEQRFGSLRAAWNWGIWSSDSDSVSLSARAGFGVGELSRQVEDPYTGSKLRSASGLGAVLEAGLDMEWGVISLLGIGVELVAPLESEAPDAPRFLFTVSVSPILLLGALK
jgi:hypothetical protein